MTVQEHGAFAALAGQQYMNLTTFRKSGQGVVTPVWFAQEGPRLYVMTRPTAGKVKRIRNGVRVLVAPASARGEPLGEAVEARARLMEPAEARVAKRALDRKYGLLKKLFDLAGRFSRAGVVHIEIVPG